MRVQQQVEAGGVYLQFLHARFCHLPLFVCELFGLIVVVEARVVVQVSVEFEFGVGTARRLVFGAFRVVFIALVKAAGGVAVIAPFAATHLSPHNSDP
jgi:hypothetical protein